MLRHWIRRHCSFLGRWSCCALKKFSLTTAGKQQTILPLSFRWNRNRYLYDTTDKLNCSSCKKKARLQVRSHKAGNQLSLPIETQTFKFFQLIKLCTRKRANLHKHRSSANRLIAFLHECRFRITVAYAKELPSDLFPRDKGEVHALRSFCPTLQRRLGDCWRIRPRVAT